MIKTALVCANALVNTLVGSLMAGRALTKISFMAMAQTIRNMTKFLVAKPLITKLFIKKIFNNTLLPNALTNLVSSLSIKPHLAKYIIAISLSGTGLYAHAAVYSVTDLGDLGSRESNPGSVNNEGYASGINNKGEVAGALVVRDSDIDNGNYHAFLYSNNRVKDLGTLSNHSYRREGYNSYAHAINDSGQVVGSSELDNGDAGPIYNRAFLYSNGSMQNLGTLESRYMEEEQLESWANAINNKGEVVGYSGRRHASYGYAFLYSNGSMKSLNTLAGGSVYDRHDSEAFGINDKGQVVGVFELANGDDHAFLYSNGSMQDLGTLPGGEDSWANDINNQGEVVGYSDLANNIDGHAFLYSNGSMQDLGTLGGESSGASAINNSGQVVGSANLANGENHAFLYHNGNMQDLNNLLDSKAKSEGWIITYADDINDNGWILATATSRAHNVRRTVLLKPVIPSTKPVNSPTVSIALPSNNTEYRLGHTIQITANAADSDGTISQVAFYQRTANGIDTLLNTDTTFPYRYDWAGAAPGTYIITSVATDNSGNITTSDSVTVIVDSQLPNVAPTVRITSPINPYASFGMYTAPATIKFTADASDSDGTVAQVKFYKKWLFTDDVELIGADTTAPYTASLTNLAAGLYTITGVATDNEGATTTTSEWMGIFVQDSSALDITSRITSPANNASYAAPATIKLTADALARNNSAVRQVQFFNGKHLLHTDTTVPYSYDWTDVTTGTYHLTAVATSSQGLPVNSNSITVHVNPAVANNAAPTISIATPSNDAQYTVGEAIKITANAADADGTISQVAFFIFDGQTLLDIDDTAPYGYDWTDAAPGRYTVTSIATDNDGAITISAPVQFTVTAANATPPQAYFIHTDHLNTPRLITDNSDNQVWQWQASDPFGDNIPDNNPSDTNESFTYNPRFAGQYFDAETNLHYNYFRDYDASTGRYIQSDPIGLAGGINTYGYVNGNPLWYVDPTGEALWWGAFACGAFTAATKYEDVALLLQVLEEANEAFADIKKLESEFLTCKNESRKAEIRKEIVELKTKRSGDLIRTGGMGLQYTGAIAAAMIACGKLPI